MSKRVADRPQPCLSNVWTTMNQSKYTSYERYYLAKVKAILVSDVRGLRESLIDLIPPSFIFGQL